MITSSNLLALLVLLPSIALPSIGKHDRHSPQHERHRRIAFEQAGENPAKEGMISWSESCRPVSRRAPQKCHSYHMSTDGSAFPTSGSSAPVIHRLIPSVGSRLSVSLGSSSHAGDAYDFVRTISGGGMMRPSLED
jgi:hypothetical protein